MERRQKSSLEQEVTLRKLDTTRRGNLTTPVKSGSRACSSRCFSRALASARDRRQGNENGEFSSFILFSGGWLASREGGSGGEGREGSPARACSNMCVLACRVQDGCVSLYYFSTCHPPSFMVTQPFLAFPLFIFPPSASSGGSGGKAVVSRMAYEL